jgi:hypothetical protein
VATAIGRQGHPGWRSSCVNRQYPPEVLQIPALHPVQRYGDGQSASVLHGPGVTSSSMHASVHPVLPQWVIWQTEAQAGELQSAPTTVQGG